MSTSYQSVMFPSLEPQDVAAARSAVVGVLVDSGLIMDQPAKTAGAGDETSEYFEFYDPTPLVRGYFGPALAGASPHVGGVGVRQGIGFNPLAFNLRDDWTCPACRKEFVGEVGDALISQGASGFWTTGRIPMVACPQCGVSSDARQWDAMGYPLGFTYLAFEFWDWPDFALPGQWSIDIPARMARAAGDSDCRIGGARL